MNSIIGNCAYTFSTQGFIFLSIAKMRGSVFSFSSMKLFILRKQKSCESFGLNQSIIYSLIFSLVGFLSICNCAVRSWIWSFSISWRKTCKLYKINTNGLVTLSMLLIAAVSMLIVLGYWKNNEMNNILTEWNILVNKLDGSHTPCNHALKALSNPPYYT